jgi:hypothetical protein
MEDNLPVVDYAGGGPALPQAAHRCPTGAILWLKGAQFQDPSDFPGRSEISHAQLR